LLEGEHLILGVSPALGFKRYVTVKAAAMGLPFLAMMNVLVAMSFYVGMGGAPITQIGVGPLLATYAVLYVILAAVLIALTVIFANLMFKKYHYWVTDQRVIWRRGILGYKITSVPLERITDVEVSRTFLETVCGVAGVVVRKMTAEEPRYYPYGYGVSVFPTMIAVPDPEGMQRQILELISRKGKESRLAV
jgi:membrane protein YdbS with pleckstrin-like domain